MLRVSFIGIICSVSYHILANLLTSSLFLHDEKVNTKRTSIDDNFIFIKLCESMTANVPRTGDVATKRKRVFSAKIEFIRENRAEATQNQQ